jgi:hypothetical protein
MARHSMVYAPAIVEVMVKPMRTPELPDGWLL